MSDQNECMKLVALLLESLQPKQTCCPPVTGDHNYDQSLVRFNETASQIAADKLQAAYDRQQDRWHVTLRQNAQNAGVAG